MRATLLSSLLLAALAATSATRSSFSHGGSVVTSARSIFGIPRGGGLFGGKNNGATAEAEAPDVSAERTIYPAMTEEEVEEWLGHIPVFAVTDSNGAGVVLKPDDETSVFYFFMSPQMANSTLQQLKSNNADMDLRVSAFSLGKVWFKILNADKDAEVKLKAPGSEGAGEVTKGVQYRLVPDTRDLLGARMLLTMDPEDGETLKAGDSISPEKAEAVIKKAMTESPKFKETYNEIPVFMIAQMRMQKKPSADASEEETVNLLPMYFNLQNMVGTWQQFMSQAGPDAQGVEPAINLMELHELVEKMMEESEIDFRNSLLIPGIPMAEGGPAQTTAEVPSQEDQMAKMGGATLGDI
jgi:hypothetical protein